MAWPLPTDFVPMLQNPGIGFRDPELKKCIVEKDPNNQPRARSGAFAVVYKGSYPHGGGDVCIRVFTTASEERRERYAAISDYLAGKKLKSLVGFEYVNSGIKCARDGQWYPLVTMEWVDGDVLFDWVRLQCVGRQKVSLRDAAERWIAVIEELSQARIAHGDLQHGNVMVQRSGSMKLVDYDCMCVPALVGHRNLEIGVEPYQHPRRDEYTVLYPGLDNFSAFFIWVALRAFAAAPELWRQFVESPNRKPYDKLLFRKEDFDDPSQSHLYQELRRSSDLKLRKAVDDLFGLVRIPLLDVPPLAHFTGDFEKVRNLLTRKAWDEAVELLGREGTAGIPADMERDVRQAQERVRARIELEHAVSRGDEVAMQRLADSPLLADYAAAAPSLQVAKRSSTVLPILRQLQSAKKSGAWKSFVQMFDQHEPTLAGRTSAEALREDVRDWRARNRAADVIIEILNSSTIDVPRLKLIWEGLEQRGGHPEVESRRAVVERILERHAALVEFRGAPGAPGSKNDEQTVRSWKEQLFSGWDEAERERPRYLEARARLSKLQTLRNEIGQRGDVVTRDGEQRITEAAAQLPADYPSDLQTRVADARLRLQAARRLEESCTAPVRSEGQIADAWKELTRLQAEPLASGELRARAEVALQRVAALASLREISAQWPLDRLDREILSRWNSDLLSDCPEADPWRDIHRNACERRPLLTQLEAALKRGDDPTIVECSHAVSLQKYPFSAAISERIAMARKSVHAARQLMDALESKQPARFAELFDHQLIHQHAERIRPFQPLMSQWLDANVLSREGLGLKPPVVGHGLVRLGDANGTYKAQWVWPAPRFTDRCLLMVCQDAPRAGTDPENLPSLRRMVIDRKSWESGGGNRIIHGKPEWKGSYVLVWACLDLGFRKFYGEPLLLGRIE